MPRIIWRALPKNRVPQLVILGGITILVIVWCVVAISGPGTFAFWQWTSASWQAVATAATGVLLAVFASLTWSVQSGQMELMRRQDEREAIRNAREYGVPAVLATADGLRVLDELGQDEADVNFNGTPIHIRRTDTGIALSAVKDPSVTLIQLTRI